MTTDRSEVAAIDRRSRLIHHEPHPLAGRTVQLAHHPDDKASGPVDYWVEDWQDRVYGFSWMDATGNPAALKYAMRSAFAGLPTDNDVVYGKVGPFGHIVHVSELIVSEATTDDGAPAWSIQPDSTFWNAEDDRMLDIWVEHGYPESNDAVHLVSACVRLRNIARQWQGIANELTRHIGAELVQVGGVEWCTVHAGVVDECGPDRTVEVTGHDGEPYEFTACDLYDDEGECNVVTLYHFAAPDAGEPAPATDWEQLSLVPASDGLVAAVAEYAGVSPDLVQVIPNREGTPS